MKVKTNTKLFHSSTMYITSVGFKNTIYHSVRPISSHRKSFAYDARTTKGLTYKLYKNLLLAVIEDYNSTQFTYDIV